MRRPLAVFGLFFIVFIIFIQLIHPIAPVSYPELESQYCTVTGHVARIEHKLRDDSDTLIIYLSSFQSDSFETCPPKAYMVMCYMAKSDYAPPLGAQLTLSGRIRNFDTATNPGMFDSQRYYDILQIATSMRDCTILNIQSDINFYWRIRNKLNHIRSNISTLIDICFNESDSAIIKTMLLGDKSALSPETKSLYSQNGIAHILAISGLHISMIGYAIYTLLKKSRLPNCICQLIPIFIMILYGIMTGMAASAARAIIMFSLRMLATLVHRTYDMATALVIAALLILIEQPKYVFYSGFQFSFGAIGAVILITPYISHVFPRIISASVAITIITLPIHLCNYYYFPVLSIILNLYIIPLMSVMLTSCITTLAISIFYIPIGHLISYLPHIILLIYEYSCKLVELIPYNKLVTGKPTNMQITIYFILIGVILYLASRLPRMHTLLSLSLACIILILPLPSGTTLTLLDVGQGDCIYISSSDKHILVDGGSSSVSSVGQYRIEPFLLYNGVASLDAVFITHLDLDHYSGIIELIDDAGLTGPKIKSLVITPAIINNDTPEYQELYNLATEHNIPIGIISEGSVVMLGRDASLECLYPTDSLISDNSNAESLTLLLRIKDINILLTGDLEGAGEDYVTHKLLDTDRLFNSEGHKKINILKVAHHGSKNSTGDSFLDSYRPNVALISAGRGNSYGHPHSELLSRLDKHKAPWYSTIDHGAISLRIRNNTLSIHGYSATRSRLRSNNVAKPILSRNMTSESESTIN